MSRTDPTFFPMFFGNPNFQPVSTAPVGHWTQGAARLMKPLGMLIRENRMRALQEENARRSAEAMRTMATGWKDSTRKAPAMPVEAPPPEVTAQGGGAGGQQEFLNRVMPLAIEASKRTGIDPRIIASQAALESGYGTKAPGNNYFGIKSHGRPGGQTFTTTEYVGGQPQKMRDSFRSYGNMGESVSDYADFMLTNPRYRPLMQAQGLDAQLAALGQSGYATDPNYAAKVGAIARGIPMPEQQPTQVAQAGNATMAFAGPNPAASDQLEAAWQNAPAGIPGLPPRPDGGEQLASLGPQVAQPAPMPQARPTNAPGGALGPQPSDLDAIPLERMFTDDPAGMEREQARRMQLYGGPIAGGGKVPKAGPGGARPMGFFGRLFGGGAAPAKEASEEAPRRAEGESFPSHVEKAFEVANDPNMTAEARKMAVDTIQRYRDLLEAPRPTSDIQEYQYAVGQGYKGSFLDYQTEKRKAGATNVTTNVGGETLTPGQKKIDETFADEYVRWKSSGFADAAKQIKQINYGLSILESGEAVTGAIGALPEALQPFINPNGTIAREAIEEIVQRSLREILGAQFTKEEGERLIARTFNPRLSPAENARRARLLLGQITTMGQAKQAMVDYFEQNGTLRGYTGPRPTMGGLNNMRFGNDGGGAPDTGAATPQAPGPRDDLKKKYGLE